MEQPSNPDGLLPRRIATLVASPARLFLLLYALSLVTSLGFGLARTFRPDPHALDADEFEYWTIASQLMAGNLELSARRTFGFPLVLAAIRSLDDNILFVQAVMAAIYALSGPLLALVVRKIGRSDVAALLAGAMMALWPPALFYGTSLYSETLAAPIFLAALLVLPDGACIPGFRGGTRWRSALGAGLLLGVATHVRPMYLLFTPFTLLIPWIEEGDLRRAVRTFVPTIAGFLILILPWAAVQTTHFHHPILVTSNGGETMAGGLNPNLLKAASDVPTPSGRITWFGAGKWLTPEQTGYLTPAESALPYDQQDKILRARTMAWVGAHPADAAYIEVCKFTYMWGIYPLARNGMVQMLFGNLPTLALLVLTAWGFARAPGPSFRLVRFWALPLFVTGVAMISWGSWRFRQPGDAGLLAFCAIAVVRALEARLALRARMADYARPLVREGVSGV